MGQRILAPFAVGALALASPALGQTGAEAGSRFGGLGDAGFIVVVIVMGLAIWYFSRKRRGV